MERCENTIYKHLKSGNLYEVLHDARMESTQEMVIVYRRYPASFREQVWVRPTLEFVEKFEKYKPLKEHKDAE